MENKDFLKRISKLGFPLFEVDKEIKVNETISEVIKNQNIRLWEGFPIIFANANRDHLFEFEKCNKLLTNKKECAIFVDLILISLSLYKYFRLKFVWEKALLNKINENDRKKIKLFFKCFKNNNYFKVSQKNLDPKRIKRIFENYYEEEESNIEMINKTNNELALEYALSQIFTPKQKEIFLKRLRGKKLTKTEREYFYRVVKKKAVALTNQDLQRLAQQILR